MTEPSSPGRQRRSLTGDSGQIREKYTAVWPEPVMRATLTSSVSFRTTPTSAEARDADRLIRRKAAISENDAPARAPFALAAGDASLVDLNVDRFTAYLLPFT